MTDPAIPLGGKRSARSADIEARVASLERTIEQIPSRYPNQPPSLSRVVTLAAHGFLFGDVVARDAAGPWDLADATNLVEPLGLVIGVLDVDTFVVALRGYFYAPGLVPDSASAVSDWTTYSLNATGGTPGTFKEIGGVEAVVPNSGGSIRGIFTTLDQGWIEVHGPVTDAHDHLFEFARNVLRPLGGYSSGQVFAYDPNCFGTGVDGWKAQTISAAMGDRAALSVFGNPTNAAATGTDIAAAASAFTVLNCNGTVLQWTQIGTSYISDGAITAVKLGADVTLEALKDVTITSAVTNDFLYWDNASTKWKNRNLGAILCIPTAGGVQQQLALDGGGGGTSTACGIAASGSRIIVANANNSIDFLQSGSVGASSDVAFRWLNNGATMEWRDLASGAPGTGTAGDKVAEWLGSATPSSRYFGWRMEQRWYDQTTTAGAGTHYLRVYSTAAQKWLLADATQNFLTFTSVDTRLTSTASIDVNGNFVLNGNLVYFGTPATTTNARITGTNTSITLNAGAATGNSITLTSGTSSGVYVDNLAPTLTYLQNGNTIYFGDNTSVPKTTAAFIQGAAFTSGSNSFVTMATNSSTTYFQILDQNPTGGGTSFIFRAESATAGSTFDLSPYGVTFKKTSAGVQQHGFFGATAVAQQTVNGAITASASSPGTTYNQANMVAMFNDTASCISAINAMRTLLRNLGFAA